MFVDFRDQPPPPRWEPKPGRKPLTPKQRRVVEGIAILNIVMLVCGPLAGATVFRAIPALFR